MSKWETGVSIPDTALLVPLAEVLGVTVTELLMCERQGAESLSAGEVESVVKTAISYSGNKSTRAYEKKGRWMLIYVLCLIAGGALTAAFYATGNGAETLAVAFGFGAVFGAFFCFFVKTRLPDYYDSNRISAYYDGPVRMNVPGVSFNNNNWPYIVRAGRIWSCAAMAAYPIICFAMGRLLPELWMQVELYVFLVLLLGGLLLPIYIVEKNINKRFPGLGRGETRKHRPEKGSFSPERRCEGLPDTKYACAFVPCSKQKSLLFRCKQFIK